MSEQEIIEGNRLIAEFMEYEHSDILYDEENEEYFFDTDHLVCVEDIEVWESSVDDWTSTLSPEQMLFHSSWDWLMPVVEKIEKENVTGFTYRYYDEPNWGIELYIVTSHYFLNSYNKLNKSFECKSSSKIESYWLACVEFIKYYNLCQKEK